MPLKRTVSTYVGLLTYTLPLRWLLTWKVSALATTCVFGCDCGSVSGLCWPFSKMTITAVYVW
jgi:hypothetical protein